MVEICGAEYLMQRKDSPFVYGGPHETPAHHAAMHATMRFYKTKQSTVSEKRSWTILSLHPGLGNT